MYHRVRPSLVSVHVDDTFAVEAHSPGARCRHPIAKAASTYLRRHDPVVDSAGGNGHCEVHTLPHVARYLHEGRPRPHEVHDGKLRRLCRDKDVRVGDQGHQLFGVCRQVLNNTHRYGGTDSITI